MSTDNRNRKGAWWQNEATAWMLALVVMLALSVGVVAERPRTPSGSPSSATAPSPSAIPPFREDASNLLANPSFETQDATLAVADKWVRIDDTGEYAIDTRAKYGGRSQRVAKKGVADPINHYSGVQQSIGGIVPGASYIVTVDYLYSFDGAPDATRSVGIVVYCLDSNDHFIDDGTSAEWGWRPTTEWTRRSLTFRAPSQAATVIVQFRISVNGTFWIDGAQLLRSDVTSPSPQVHSLKPREPRTS